MSADLEQRVAKVEGTLTQMLTQLQPILEMMSTRLPPAIQNQWLVKKMEEKHYLTWSDLSTDTEFAAMFLYPQKFYYQANQMARMRGWKIAKVERQIYYYTDDFDIEAIRKKVKWRNYRPSDPKFMASLVKDVIEPVEEPVNILDYLRDAYPNRSDNWCNEVIDSLAAYIKREGYKIERRGDVFSKTERGESG